MAKRAFNSVDEYLAAQPENVRPIIRLVRNTLRKALPKAEEVISYEMPTYKLAGKPVLYFAGWKQHFSLYPATATILEKFRDEIAPYVVHKSTIRFLLTQPVPVRLIGRIARFRAGEVLRTQRPG